ncbi:MAG: ABC transporter substrate-binding protein [Thermoleophilia bacterium]
MTQEEKDLGVVSEALNRRYSRREILLKSAVVVGAGTTLGSLLVACGGDGGTTSTPSASSSAGFTTETPKQGGTLVYARRAATETLDPLQNRNGNGDIFAAEIVYTALVRPDPMGSTALVPGLADRWELSADRLDYTFHIRDNARFSNGDAVTSDDVKFSLDRFGDPKLNAIYGVLAVGYKGTDVVDKSTVIVHLSQPVSAFLYNISILPAFILPKKLVEEQGKKFFEKPVGTGPFMVSEWLTGSHMTFVPNPYYWEDGKPYLDEVRFDFATDDNARMLALRSGTAQAADGVPFSEISGLKSNTAVYLQFTDVPYFQGLWLNHKRPELADLNVRQALQYALDKEAINKAVYAGTGTIPNSVLPKLRYDGSPEQVAPYPYDVTKAKELMAASGFPNGFSTTLQYPSEFAYYSRLALILQAAWKEIGVSAKLIQQDQGTTSQRFYQFDYDLTFPYAQFTSDVVVPDEYISFICDPNSGTDGFFTAWHDDAIWKQVQEFESADEASRESLWPQIQQAFMDATPVINVMNLPFVQAYQANVKNPYINALGANRLEDTWLA